MIAGDFAGRRAPYAPISALQRFFDRIRDRQAPELVDHTFLARLNVASNNEYALLSALKFLGIVDDRGKPTHAYRLLQTTDRFETTLRHLVMTAYRPVFDAGADTWAPEDLVNYFRLTSSASQARNAARFFYAVCRLAGMSGGRARPLEEEAPVETEAPGEEEAAPAAAVPSAEPMVEAPRTVPAADLELELLRTKARLLEKLPAADPSWSAAEYGAICAAFVTMLQSLEPSH